MPVENPYDVDPAEDLTHKAPGDVALFRMTKLGPAKHCGIVGEHVLPHAGPLPQRRVLTLIHARQNRRVTEEQFSPLWQSTLVHAFRL